MTKILGMAVLIFHSLTAIRAISLLRKYTDDHILFRDKEMFSPTAGFPVSETFPIQ